jgi:hypothetical protein
MLNYARSCVGKPFSNTGMARSLIWPRKTDEQSFFCAGARTMHRLRTFARVCVGLDGFPCAGSQSWSQRC